MRLRQNEYGKGTGTFITIFDMENRSALILFFDKIRYFFFHFAILKGFDFYHSFKYFEIQVREMGFANGVLSFPNFPAFDLNKFQKKEI